MRSLSDSQIDEAILSVVGASWRKVAYVISKVAKAVNGNDLPEGDAEYNLVAGRIEVLVRDGCLLAQGDLKRWRHSEVRKPE